MPKSGKSQKTSILDKAYNAQAEANRKYANSLASGVIDKQMKKSTPVDKYNATMKKKVPAMGLNILNDKKKIATRGAIQLRKER